MRQTKVMSQLRNLNSLNLTYCKWIDKSCRPQIKILTAVKTVNSYNKLRFQQEPRQWPQGGEPLPKSHHSLTQVEARKS